MVAVHAARREGRERLAGVLRLARLRVELNDVIRIRRIAPHLAVVPRGAVLIVHLLPRRAAVLAAVEPRGRCLSVNRSIHNGRLRFANAQTDAAQVAGRQPFLELRPSAAGVGRLEDSGLRSPGQESVLATLALERRGVEHVGVRRIHRDLGEPGVLADLLEVRPRLAAVGGLEEAAFAAGRPQRTDRRDVHDIRVARVDDDLADVLRRRQHGARPGLARVGGLVDAGAPRRAAHIVRFARSDPHHVRVARRDSDRADGSRAYRVEHRRPAHPGIGRLPHATRCGRDVHHGPDPRPGRLRIDDDRDVGNTTRHDRRPDGTKRERPNENGVRRERGVAANSGQRNRSAGLVDGRSALRAGDGD